MQKTLKIHIRVPLKITYEMITNTVYLCLLCAYVFLDKIISLIIQNTQFYFFCLKLLCLFNYS